MNITVSDTASQQSICQACGICCDGTLFGQADIDSSGPDPSWPAEVIRSVSDGKKLPQPCPAYQKQLCVIYSSRPKICVDFSCILLKEYSSGTISLQEALSTIQTTRGYQSAFNEAISEVITREANSSPDRLFGQFRSLFKKEFDTAEFRKAHSKILLIYARLKHQLRTRFHQPEQKTSLP